ncbi:NAD(+) synthase [Candidatus Poribacteria bacterium]|nr:NAD(+) synthase [Candidatus Poribacteria bacterium]
MMKATLATCNLNQWALDFEGNCERIIDSIEQSKSLGARYRLGPELEITGYSCEDHFLEEDTLRHSWESLARIITGGHTDNILCDIGMPVMHKSIRYNCRVFVCNGEILLIRPKVVLAAEGNYREPRWFAAWQKGWSTEPFHLPLEIRDITKNKTVPIGCAVIVTHDTILASETCEELFAPHSPHIDLAYNGVEIITNGSGSHHELRKLDTRLSLIRNATDKCGGVYLYANQQGCDGGRLYFDGCASIAQNGEILAQGSQFSLNDVEVITATVDLSDVRSYRGSRMSGAVQASRGINIPQTNVDFKISDSTKRDVTVPMENLNIHSPDEEIALGPACWLWDYLRRSEAAGYFVPLSGGSDSGAVATLVGSMCQLVAKAILADKQHVIRDTERLLGQECVTKIKTDYNHYLQAAQFLANQLLYTCYMGTDNSSRETKLRAKQLASEIGSYHLDINIELLVSALRKLFSGITGKTPKFKTDGGTTVENQALQNIQARLRMVISYLFAQTLPWVRNRRGTLLVLGTGNVDEALRGYLTKYDCSSADINPIGSISKTDLRSFLDWAQEHLGYPSLATILEAPPTAELEPITETYTQIDEEDMDMTYAELSRFGQLRKVHRCGPVSMFEKLVQEWNHLPANEVADKVKKFFRYYAINRHKMTTLTPAYHAEPYSPDDNRFDLRQFLYNTRWTWQFKKIDKMLEELDSK